MISQHHLLIPNLTGRLESKGLAVVVQSMYYDIVLNLAQYDCSLHELTVFHFIWCSAWDQSVVYGAAHAHGKLL